MLRVGPLGVGGGVEGLAPQVGDVVDGVPLLQNIEHPQGVDGQHLDGPAALGVEVGGGVGGDGGDVHIPVDQGALDLGVVGDDLIGGDGAALRVRVVVGH